MELYIFYTPILHLCQCTFSKYWGIPYNQLTLRFWALKGRITPEEVREILED